MNILKSRELRISYNEDAISAILKIKSQNILLSVNYAEKTRFREIKDMMR